MQLVAERGIAQCASKLLEEGVDPNYPIDVDRREGNNNNKSSDKEDYDRDLPPVLLAAKHGHWSVLEAFKDHNDQCTTSGHLKITDNPESDGENTLPRSPKILLQPMHEISTNEHGIRKVPCNFTVGSVQTEETILHQILKEPKLKLLRCTKTQRKAVREQYEKCLDVILGSDDHKLSSVHIDQIRYSTVSYTHLRAHET